MSQTLPASVNLMPDAPVAEIVALARHAEQLGYQRVSVYDEGLAARDVHVTLAAIAVATQRVQLGPGITNPHTRHPGTTAAAIASLDELSDGRAFLGLGAGGSLTLNPLGIQRSKPLTAVREMVVACRSLFAGDTVTMDGSTLHLSGATLSYARSDIPIWLAGRGPRMMQTAGELADGFNLSYVHKDLLGELVTGIRSAAPGTPPRISYSTKLVTTDQAFEDARANLTFRLLDSPVDVRERVGFSPDDATAVRAALARGGPAAAAPLMRDEWVTPFVLAGSTEAIRSELRSLLDTYDIDEFQLPVQELGEARDTMDLVAELLSE